MQIYSDESVITNIDLFSDNNGFYMYVLPIHLFSMVLCNKKFQKIEHEEVKKLKS